MLSLDQLALHYNLYIELSFSLVHKVEKHRKKNRESSKEDFYFFIKAQADLGKSWANKHSHPHEQQWRGFQTRPSSCQG